MKIKMFPSIRKPSDWENQKRNRQFSVVVVVGDGVILVLGNVEFGSYLRICDL